CCSEVQDEVAAQMTRVCSIAADRLQCVPVTVGPQISGLKTLGRRCPAVRIPLSERSPPPTHARTHARTHDRAHTGHRPNTTHVHVHADTHRNTREHTPTWKRAVECYGIQSVRGRQPAPLLLLLHCAHTDLFHHT